MEDHRDRPDCPHRKERGGGQPSQRCLRYPHGPLLPARRQRGRHLHLPPGRLHRRPRDLERRRGTGRRGGDSYGRPVQPHVHGYLRCSLPHGPCPSTSPCAPRWAGARWWTARAASVWRLFSSRKRARPLSPRKGRAPAALWGILSENLGDASAYRPPRHQAGRESHGRRGSAGRWSAGAVGDGWEALAVSRSMLTAMAVSTCWRNSDQAHQRGNAKPQISPPAEFRAPTRARYRGQAAHVLDSRTRSMIASRSAPTGRVPERASRSD